MPNRAWIALLATAALLAGAAPGPAAPAPPAAPADGEFKIGIEVPGNGRNPGGAEEFLVAPNPLAPGGWYYLPATLRVSETVENGLVKPDFAFIRFQRTDPGNRERLIEGGLLSFALDLRRDARTLDLLAAELRRRLATAEVSLSLMPLRTAVLAMLHPTTGARLTASAESKAYGTVQVVDRLAFSLRFDREAARTLEPLLLGTAGALISVEFRYNRTLVPGVAPAPSPSGTTPAPSPGDGSRPDLATLRRWREDGAFTATGTIGAAKYPPAVRERIVTSEEFKRWDAALMVLPDVGFDPALGIASASFELGVVNEAKREAGTAEVYTWSSADGRWRDRTGSVTLIARVPLGDLVARVGEEKLRDYGFRMTKGIVYEWLDEKSIRRAGRLKEIASCPLFDGESPVGNPESFVDVLTIDPTLLAWKASGAAGADLEALLVNVTCGNLTVTKRLAPRRDRGALALPGPTYVLLPRDRKKPVVANIRFELAGGRTATWANPARIDYNATLAITLFDGEWRP